MRETFSEYPSRLAIMKWSSTLYIDQCGGNLWPLSLHFSQLSIRRMTFPKLDFFFQTLICVFLFAKFVYYQSIKSHCSKFLM